MVQAGVFEIETALQVASGGCPDGPVVVEAGEFGCLYRDQVAAQVAQYRLELLAGRAVEVVEPGLQQVPQVGDRRLGCRSDLFKLIEVVERGTDHRNPSKRFLIPA